MTAQHHRAPSQTHEPAIAEAAGWRLACPACRSQPGHMGGADRAACPGCGTHYAREDGIWRLLAPGRAAYYAAFLSDYTRIRHREGRGSENPAYYLRLPQPAPGDPLAWQWAMRARSFACLEQSVLPRLGDSLRVLDLGAGVGWLSYRLALAGHQPCAVDLSMDDRDGLGAARHYGPDQTWPRLQAEFDRLPLAEAQADLVIYNASLHYSSDYEATLAEALRVLKPAGRIVVMDSPIYRRDESGRRMLAERYAAFARRHGTRSDAVPSIGYLTWTGLDDLAARLGVRWTVMTPWYGLRWALRPLRARLLRQREPSRFALLVAERRNKR